ncbi:hypothetical protein H3J60_004584 [Salmonella enterica]|nr:hypothetical protein [Salmonella enterica]
MKKPKVADFAEQSAVNLTTLVMLCVQTVFTLLISVFRVFIPKASETKKE